MTLPLSTTRVGYVLKRYPRYSETFVVNEILALERLGVELTIFALRPSNDTHFQNIISQVQAPVIYLPHRMPRAEDFWDTLRQAAGRIAHDRLLARSDTEEALEVYQALHLAREVSERNIQHLHAHFATSATGVARMAAGLANIGYSFTAHAKDIYHDSVSAQDLSRKLEDAARVVTVSDYNLSYLDQHFDLAKVRLGRLYNGLDLEAFDFHSPRSRPRRILAVGRLVEKKGFDDLISACALLAESGERFECRIIGSGDQEALLHELIDSFDLRGSVTLLGPLPQSEVKRELSEAAALAVPCVIGQDNNRDGLPTVLLEAMALGTPCVSTDVTGIPELLADELTGLQVPQRDPEALADALQRLLEDELLRVRLAAAARARIEADFDVHRNVVTLRRLFKESIQETRDPGEILS